MLMCMHTYSFYLIMPQPFILKRGKAPDSSQSDFLLLNKTVVRYTATEHHRSQPGTLLVNNIVANQTHC